MKKLLSLALALLMLASVATVALASTTTLTTTVPPATYTLNIPADQEIPFGAVSTEIGAISVTDGTGFAEGKNLKVMLTYDAFASDGISTTIPFKISMKDSNSQSYFNSFDLPSGEVLTFKGKSSGATDEYSIYTCSTVDGSRTLTLDTTRVYISSTDWGKALAGDYTATITFTAEVVAE